MIFINEEKLNFSLVRNYTGDDPIIKLLSDGLRDIEELGYPVRLKCPSLSKGMRSGRQAIWVPYTATVNTNKGTKTVVYCESAPKVKDNLKYFPRGDWFKKAWILHEHDIEKILFMTKISSLATDKVIVLENTEAEQRAISNKRGESSALLYLLYNSSSPIHDDLDMIRSLSYAWGLTQVDKKGIEQLKNELHDVVVRADSTGQLEYGFMAFTAATEEFTPYLKTLALVQKASDKGVIKWEDKQFRWVFTTDEGGTQVLCKIAPVEASRKKEILAEFLLNHPDDQEAIELSLGVTKKDKPRIEITSDMDFSKLSWQEIQRLCKQNGIPTKGRRQPEIMEELKMHKETLR